jgi:hypothetical protein
MSEQSIAEQGYNGWSNYETWNVALWLSNDEGTYNLTREMADEAREESRQRFQGRENVARRLLADGLQGLVEDAAPDLGASMFADLLGAALSRVDWFEIARNILDES